MAEKAKRGPEKGSQVSEETLTRAARAWIELEDEKKWSKSAVAHKAGFKRTPDWFESDKFLQILELERFNVELNRVQGLKGASVVVDQILSLGFGEMYRRLKLTPKDIPYPQLFGDLTRLLKMRAELEVQAKGGIQAPASLLITIRQELLNVPDLRLREAVIRQVFSEYKSALSSIKDLLPDGGDHDVVDVVGVDVGVPGADRTLALPAPAVVGGGAWVPLGAARVWSDPVEVDR